MKKFKKPDVLVLNTGYIPIHVVEWEVGMSLIYTEKCRALDREFIAYAYKDWLSFSLMDADTYPKIGTVQGPIAIPEIIVSTTFDHLPDKKVKYSRQNVFVRDKHRCGYCGKQLPLKSLTIDHIFPRDKGGKTTWENIISCCFDCNQKKANRTPEQAGMTLKFKPHAPRWISPLENVDTEIHPCKSWKHFLNRISTSYDDQNSEID